MQCPICRRAVQEQDPYYPFCSVRCKWIDLGKWASEEYKIPAPLKPEPVHDDGE